MSLPTKRFYPKLAAMAVGVSLAVVLACSGESKAKEKPHYVVKEAPASGPLANIDGQPVTEEELMGEGEERMEYGEALRKVYDARMGRVGTMLLERVYGADAKKANLPVSEYVETKVLKGEPSVSNSEFEKFVKEKQIPKEQVGQLKDRIYAYMKMTKKQEQLQTLIVKLSKEHKVELFFGKPNVKVNIEIGDAPYSGSKDAKVKIVVFSDFQCPFCGRAAKTVEEIRKVYGKKIELAFKQFPLPMHPNARPAAEASLCVAEQGTDKFWKFHDKAFANQEKLDGDNLKKIAKESGVDVDKFNKCVEEKKYAKAVDDDMAYGSKVGVRSTPTFFINGKPIAGAQPFEQFKEQIDDELAGG